MMSYADTDNIQQRRWQRHYYVICCRSQGNQCGNGKFNNSEVCAVDISDDSYTEYMNGIWIREYDMDTLDELAINVINLIILRLIYTEQILKVLLRNNYLICK